MNATLSTAARNNPMPVSSDAITLHQAGDRVIEEATALLKAMGNENRLRILCLLSDSEMSVSELNSRLELSQSALSQHLAILRREGMVRTRRASQTIYYSLQGPNAAGVIRTLQNLYN
tara:strand:- start:2096 stop:2449 length:354 start_codon:yes stop_codon:yes gene_type:complete